jgi:hypothetical protein
MAWITPAAACSLFVTLMVPSMYSLRGFPADGLQVGDPAQRAVLRFASEQSAQNALPSASFTWTNHVPAPSTTRSGSFVQ